MSKPFPPSFLISIAEAALSNGRDLIADAEILLAAHRIPRVLALSSLAIEEFSKALLIYGIVWANRNGQVVDQKLIRQTLVKHQVKLALPHIVASALTSPRAESLEEEMKRLTDYLPTALSHGGKADRIKQFGLYVDFTDDTVIIPSESITPSHAEAELSFAKHFAQSLEPIQRWLVEDGVLPLRSQV